ncbi:MAG: GNAT family N-acetyltransferase [Planctomycetota bacterium]|jgi:GNAT superfamily N-acetyltransferase
MEIRALRATDDRTAFRSGDADLDRFLVKYAGQSQFRHHIGSTYVADEDGRILGYATVAPGQLEFEDLPQARRKKLPRYPLPVLRLARLAVDLAAQGQRVGTTLLRFVFRLALRLADEYGCAGVVVDAKPGAVSFYEGLGFFPLELLEGHGAARPVPTSMFLPIQDIRAAGGVRQKPKQQP